MSGVAVRAENLTKTYRGLDARRRLRALFGAGLLAKNTERAALAPISFTIDRGEAVGLIGSNGSGKSTLLKMLAGVMLPTAGRAEVSGRVSALLELGTGFHPEFSGRENIVHACLLAGLTRAEIRALEPEIIRFAELEEAIDDPLKTYSSGMAMRLGFSVAHAVHPQVLLVDEVLAVGDIAFRLKCYDRLREFCAGGGTFVLVSHDLSSILRMCRRCLWLERGELKMDGPAREVGEAYQNFVMSLEDRRLSQKRAAQRRSGDGAKPAVLNVELRGPEQTRPRFQFRPGEQLLVDVTISTPRPLVQARVRVLARRHDHVCLLELVSPARELSAGQHHIVADLGGHRLGPGELHWSAALEENGLTIAAFGVDHHSGEPVPMGIIARPDDVLERGALRHRATWSKVEPTSS